MDQTLGLLGGGATSATSSGGASGGGGGFSKEKDYMGVSSEGSSSYENEAEIELGLGLGRKRSAEKWGSDNVRILTAKDLPNALSGTKRAAADCVSPSSGVLLSQVVGWPPVRAYRINSLGSQSKAATTVEEEKEVGGNEKKDNLKKKTNYGNSHKKANELDGSTKEKGCQGFIKVNMDGLAIGRKVDLNAHSCYESLAKALANMFFNSAPTIGGEKEQSRQPPNLLDESSEFVLTYEDKEGDWMLVGDVPWGMFLCTVKRLRIMRNTEANGISPAVFQERQEKQKSKCK